MESDQYSQILDEQDLPFEMINNWDETELAFFNKSIETDQEKIEPVQIKDQLIQKGRIMVVDDEPFNVCGLRIII